MEILRGGVVGFQYMAAAMSYRDALRHGESNVGLGMAPHKAKCRCDECEVTRLSTRIAELENTEESYRAVAEYRQQEIDKLEAMLWMAYRKSGSPIGYRDWRRLMRGEGG